MKSNILKSSFFTALAAGVLSGCVTGDDYQQPQAVCFTATPTKTVAEIYALAPASSIGVGTPILYTNDDVIEAYITSSDDGGTFYKSVSMQTLDGSLAFSVPVDLYNIYSEMEPGRKVYVYLKGRYFNQTYGSLIIGDSYVDPATPDEDPQIGRLVPEEFRRAVKPSCESVDEDVLVQHLTIAEALNDNNINKLIEFDDVQFSDEALNKKYYEEDNEIGGATNHNLVDAEGNSIIFRTSSFAKFAGHRVPSGRGKVRGVLTKYRGDWQFLARTEDDIQLTGGRLVPLFYENFSSASDGTNLNIPGWTNVAVQGTKVWKEEVFGGNGYAEFSSFGTGAASNIAWLVTPGIDMDTFGGEELTFRSAQHHLDIDSPLNSLQVYVSTDFTGNVTTATWTQVTVTLPTQATDWYEFINSGAVDLSGYSGTLYVGFKFTGSGTNTLYDGAFQIDDVKVSGN